MKRALLAAVFWICCSTPASAASLDLLTPYLSGQYYTWEEHGGGRRILRESGPLFCAGILVGGVTDFSLTLTGRGELFGGHVGYDGETQAPGSVPISTDVTYLGTRGEFDLGYRATVGNWRLEPFAGIGYRWWLRDLQDTTSAPGERVSGYTESWQSGYARLGARGAYSAPSRRTLFLAGGAKRPFYTGNSIDFSGSGTTTFHPGARWSGFAETGLGWGGFRLTLSYEGFRYSSSPMKLVGTRFFFQPDSSSDIFGVNLGWAFR